MASVSENLERHYNSFINEAGLFDFYTGLADYTNYMLETPQLKEIVDAVMLKKNEEYQKLTQLEEQTLKELRIAKEKLLKVIKNHKISPDSLQHITTIAAGASESESVLKTLERFENGDIHQNNFDSDVLENYLFDIAVGISKQGHRDKVQEFVVPNRKSNNIYSDVRYFFSDTINARRNQAEAVQQSRRLEIWGAFDHLLKFQRAYVEQCRNAHFVEVLEKYGDRSRNRLEIKDAVDITFGVEDIKKIVNMRYGRVLDTDLHYLKLPNFKGYIKRAHSFLSKELPQVIKEGDKNRLKSLYLITNSLEPATAIFLVLDERFETPVRYEVINKDGQHTAIKKLYDIAYFVDAPNKMVNYGKNIADGINNGLFRKKAVKKYMETNRFNKPTLVEKSKNKTLVLKNEILVKTGLVKNDVPIQYQSIYIDKTR